MSNHRSAVLPRSVSIQKLATPSASGSLRMKVTPSEISSLLSTADLYAPSVIPLRQVDHLPGLAARPLLPADVPGSVLIGMSPKPTEPSDSQDASLGIGAAGGCALSVMARINAAPRKVGSASAGRR